MFTGIIESAGEVVALERGDSGARLLLKPAEIPVGELAVGESVAVNGCCLTVTEADAAAGTVSFDLLEETLRVTNLGDLGEGGVVNLERALRVGDRMSGHYVQGHVDCVSNVIAYEEDGDDHRLEVALPEEFERYVVYKGSIAIDGISLTVAEVSRDVASADVVVVWIIPHTHAVTNLRGRRAGDRVNLEFDILAKYAEKGETPPMPQ